MIPVDMPPTDLGDDDDEQRREEQRREEELRRECEARPRLDRLAVYKQGYMPGALCRFIGIWPDEPIPAHTDLLAHNAQHYGGSTANSPQWIPRPDILDENILKTYIGEICTIREVFHVGREGPYLLKLLYSDGATTVIEDYAVELLTTSPGSSSDRVPDVTG